MTAKLILRVGIVTFALGACSTGPPTPSRCAASYAPTEPTLVLHYRRTGAVGDAAPTTVEQRLEVVESSDRLVRLRFGEGGSRGATLIRGCSAAGIEDPYIGWLPAPGSEQLVHGTLPTELREAVSWVTSVRLTWPGVPDAHADADRHYTVEDIDRTTVPAGAFETWRVAFDERAGEYSAQGTLWLDREVGLVRMEQRTGSAFVTTELMAVDHIER